MDNGFPTYEDAEYEDVDMDLYEDDEMYWDVEDDHDYTPAETHFTFAQLKNDCIIPAINSLSPIGKLVIYNLLLRLITSSVPLKRVWVDLLSITVGLAALHLFTQNKSVYVVLLCVISYVSLYAIDKILNKKYGPFCAVVTVLYLVTCEIFIVESKDWHIIRGIQMIATMKIISLGFDLDSGVVSRFPSALEFFGYSLCPGSVIFGPWHSYNQYFQFFSKLHLSGFWIVLLRLLGSCLAGTIFLLLSTCFTQWFILDSYSKWFVAYRDALSFRSSHYFISFISEVTLLIVGADVFQSNVWKCLVSQPHNIELPRSLTDVVISWNIPMHYWLKTYVFKVVKPLNTFAGILTTYAASSLLHGLNFQLAAVLLSLGFYTYIEFIFRQKLASIFSACILARKCRSECSHIYKQKDPLVFLTNFAFLFMTIFHLAYLGVMFDDNSAIQEQGYDMNHTLSKWSNLNYASHWIVLGIYIIYLLV